MSPRFVDRLRPYFRSRPKARTAAPSAAPGSASPPTAPTPVARPAPPPPAKGRRGRKRRRAAAASSPGPGGDLALRRDQLARQFAELQNDLGGLVYEMAIRDSFRIEVVVRRAAALQAVDAELAATERALRGGADSFAGRCPACSTPYLSGAAFCSSCGGPLGATPPAAAPTGVAPAAGTAAPRSAATPQKPPAPGPGQATPAAAPSAPPPGGAR